MSDLPEWPPSIQRQRDDLTSRGYVEVPEHRGLKPGARIRHAGHRWSDAIRLGTSTVVAVYERPDSAWSASWHMADIEVVHQADDMEPGRCACTWAQYHCVLADEQPSP